MTSAKTNRPWLQSFKSAVERAKNKDHNGVKIGGLDQVHKLARNYIVSLDLGGPNMNLVTNIDYLTHTTGVDGKTRYLLWVENWKAFYAELSGLIRYYKKADRDELFRLKETAQVMLNARHIGKLASWAIVQKSLRLNQK